MTLIWYNYYYIIVLCESNDIDIRVDHGNYMICSC